MLHAGALHPPHPPHLFSWSNRYMPQRYEKISTWLLQLILSLASELALSGLELALGTNYFLCTAKAVTGFRAICYIRATCNILIKI